MTISSSLNAGVAGLSANASRLAAIADNIANSATFGYKREETDFHAMVMSSGSTSSYVAGGVRTTQMRMIASHGPLIGTTNATDMAIDGRGFLPVCDVAALTDSSSNYPITLVTTGSFRADDDGILRTASGQVLMGWPADLVANSHVFPRDTLASLMPVKVGTNQFVGNPTTTLALSVNLPSAATLSGAVVVTSPFATEYFDNLGGSEALNFDFTPTVPATGQSNEWTMTVRDSASANAIIGQYTLQFNPAQIGGGTLLSVTTVSGGAYNATTGTLDLAVAGGAIALTIGKPAQIDGSTQLATVFTPVQVAKNGSPVASLASVEIDEKGFLYAVYDQGFTRKLYQIPVVDVPNPNGLTSLNDQSYRISVDSGPIYLWDAGDGPTGTVLGYTREESSIDVAAELTQLIQTQRAYSSNAKVIQTVDEMLQETNGIKR
jgi:flagellar hook protein FlgE